MREDAAEAAAGGSAGQETDGWDGRERLRSCGGPDIKHSAVTRPLQSATLRLSVPWAYAQLTWTRRGWGCDPIWRCWGASAGAQMAGVVRLVGGSQRGPWRGWGMPSGGPGPAGRRWVADESGRGGWGEGGCRGEAGGRATVAGGAGPVADAVGGSDGGWGGGG